MSAEPHRPHRASRSERLVTVCRWLCGRSLTQAYACAERAVQEAEAAGEGEQLAHALNLMATIELDLNLVASARVNFRRARDVALQWHSLDAQIRVANNAGMMHTTSGDFALAAQQFRYAQTLMTEPGFDRSGVMPGVVLSNLARLHLYWEEPERALHVLDTYELSASPHGRVRLHAAFARARAHVMLARRAETLNRPAERLRHLVALEDALADADRDEDNVWRFVGRATRAELHAQWHALHGRQDEAVWGLRDTLKEIRGQFAEGVIQLNITLGTLLLHSDPDAALQAFQEALSLMDQSGAHSDRCRVMEHLAALHEAQGRPGEALHLMRQVVRELSARQRRAPAELTPLPLDGTPEDRPGSVDWQDRLRVAEKQARTDPLTGLANRLALNETLPGLIQRLKLPHHALHVLLLDIDHFKVVNDQFSHGVGDQVLRRVAALLPVVAGNDSLTARYGGEELLVGLTHGTLAEAQRVAEELRVRVEAMRWPNGPEQVTVSVGVAEATAQDSLDRLIARADEALYAAKRAGRNRVNVALPLAETVSV